MSWPGLVSVAGWLTKPWPFLQLSRRIKLHFNMTKCTLQLEWHYFLIARLFPALTRLPLLCVLFTGTFKELWLSSES